MNRKELKKTAAFAAVFLLNDHFTENQRNEVDVFRFSK